jgi:hypothetical protein
MNSKGNFESTVEATVEDCLKDRGVTKNQR